jgi:hypothetical protein
MTYPKKLNMPREQFYTYSRLIQKDRVLGKYSREEDDKHPIVPHFVKSEPLPTYTVPEFGAGEQDPELAPMQKTIREVAVYSAHRQAQPSEKFPSYTESKYRKKCRPSDSIPNGKPLNADETAAVLDDLAAENSEEDESLKKFYPKAKGFNSPHAPLLDLDLRNHTVWEGMSVKFIIKGTGYPKPQCTFFHNNIPIEPNLHAPGKYAIYENAGGCHVLEINRVTIKDGGIIRAALQNHKGAIDSIGFLNVRRHDDSRYGYYDIKSGYNIKKPSDYPDVQHLNVPGYPRFQTRLYNQSCFEQDAVTLCCKVAGKPSPDIFWCLNGKPVKHIPGHIEVEFNKKTGLTSITIFRAHTDDEGEYTCRAYNTDGASSTKMYLFVKGRKGAPSAPADLELLSKDSTHFMLRWRQSGYLGWYNPPPVDGYLIEYCEANFPSLRKESTRWKKYNPKNLAKLMQHPVTGLDQDIPWFFRVRAINRWGTSPPSRPIGPCVYRDPGTARTEIEIEEPTHFVPPAAEEIFVEEQEPEFVPGIPSDVWAKAAGEGAVSVWFSEPVEEEGNPEIRKEWQHPPKDVSEEIDGYIIEYSVNEADDWKQANSDPIAYTRDPYPVSGLDDGVEYQFRVRAVNKHGQSDASRETDAILCGQEAQADFIMSAGTSQATGSCVDSASVVSSSACTASSSRTLTAGSKTSIVSQSAMSMGAISEGQRAMDCHYRGPPTCPEFCDFRKSYRDFIEVTWCPPQKSGGDVVNYYVEKSQLGSGEWSMCNQVATKFSQYVVNGLKVGERYIFRVRAVNQYGTSPFSKASEPVAAYDGIKPPAYYGPVHSFFRVAMENGLPMVTKNSIKVCWDEPQRDNGGTILGYHLEMRPVGGKFRPVNNRALQRRHFQITEGLKEGEGYQFRVCAFNISGRSVWLYLPGKVVCKDPELPKAPTDVWITGLGNEWCSMKWEKPTDFGDGEFKGYLVEKRKEGSDLWLPVNKHPEMCEKPAYRADGLVTGETYFFRIFAVNAYGKSQPSMQSCFVRPGEPWREVEIRQAAMYAARLQAEKDAAEAARLAYEKEKLEPFTSHMEDYWAANGKDAHFEVEVKNEDWEVEWFLGNDQETPLSPTGKYHIIKIGKIRKLIIHDCQPGDIQVINAKCFNRISQADLMVDQVAPAHWIDRLSDQDKPKGEDCFMRVTVTQEIAEVKWYKSGAAAGEETEITIDDIGDKYEIICQGHQRCLIIRNLDYDDIATYRVCGPGGSSSCCLSVDGLNPVQFGKLLENQLNVKHTTRYVEFELDIITSHKDGHKQPEMQWLYDDKPGFQCRDGRDGREVDFDDEQFKDRLEIISCGNRRLFRLKCPRWDDSGRYTIYHPGGFSTAILKVLPPPPPPAPPLPSAEDTILHFTKGLRAEHKIGGARLYCEVENLPEDIIISWTKNGKELEEDTRKKTKVDFQTGVVSVEINQINTTDAGRYQVSFVTPLGMFDTRVNYEFSGDLFKAIMRKAMDCEEDERILAEEKEAKKSAPAEQDLVVEEESFVEDNKDLEEIDERLEQLEQENEISQEADAAE